MKVKELYIKKYHQFEDFTLNLTYPDGHKFAGQPLNKVCFIGQSGTGKTSLLELLKHFIENHNMGDIHRYDNSLSSPNTMKPVFSKLKRTIEHDLDNGFYIIFSTGKVNSIDKVEIESITHLNFDLELTVLTNTGGREFIDSDLNEKISYVTLENSYNGDVENYLMGLSTHNYGVQSKANLEGYFKYIDRIEPRLFYFPSDIPIPKKQKDNLNQSQDRVIANHKFYGGGQSFQIDNINVHSSEKKNTVIDFSSYKVDEIWKTIRQNITTYRELEIKKSIEIAQIAQRPNVNPNDIIKASDNLKKWKQEFPSPVEELANQYLNKIINRFQLEVKTELDFERTEDIESIKIQSFIDKKEIPFEALSTGTKQVILTALPLYGLKPKDSIILFDEPERSLYPDIQTEIVDFYTSMAENSQFFFATHSPLVAASFEPWEIIELKFNEETGNVEQELYYDIEKGRHIDNYTIYPQYLTYDGILKRVFDIKREPNDLRTSELVKLATLESQLKHNNLSSEAKKEKFEEYKKLADQLDWDLK
jgi:ABC-type lipoprotein export system ATPase subunit